MRPPFTPLLAFAMALAPMAAQALVVPLDHSMRLRVPGSASSVLVGNPAIADVTVIDSRTLYVQGRGLGATNVIVLDRAGRTLYAGDVLVGTSGSSITVYRGTDHADFGCSPRCTASQTVQEKYMDALTGALASKSVTPSVPGTSPVSP